MEREPERGHWEPGGERQMSSPLERLYDAVSEQLYRFFYHQVGNREEAEDLTGEVFLKADRKSVV